MRRAYAAPKRIWLALRNVRHAGATRRANYGHLAMQQFAILFENRFTASAS